jgi:hypothetical protein
MTLTTLLLARISTGLGSLALLAQEDKEPAYAIPWLLVLLGLILGTMLAMRPDKRETDVKRHR